jgi:uridine kinase
MALRSEHSAPTSHALSPRYNIAEIAEAVRQALPRCGDVRVITVDGLAGSGKSTLASLLSAELGDCPIVHLDDVYEGWTQDLNVKLAERTCAWILTPLRHGMPAHYMVFDWYQGRYTQWREIPVVPYLIIEGVSAGHPEIAMRAAYNIWVDCDHELLYNRVVERDGEIVASQMKTWQLHENAFFADYDVRGNADLIVRGD